MVLKDEMEMCYKKNYIPVWISHLKKDRYIDECISRLIEEANENNLRTCASCCGHGKYPKTLVVKGNNGNAIEIFSGAIIKRTRNFYKKDKEGFYFIPETLIKVKK